MGGLFFGTTNLNGTFTPNDDLRSIEYPDIPRLRMDRHGSIEDFTTVALRAIKYFQQHIMKRAAPTWVPIVANYPQVKIQEGSYIRRDAQTDRILSLDDFYFYNPFADMVTYTLKLQAPAGFKEAFGKQKMRAAQQRETYAIAEQPGQYYSVVGMPMDNLVQFDCWSSTGRGAVKLAAWFKVFMEYMKGSIMRQGFPKIEFWERGEDRDIEAWRDDIAVASLQYYVRTEEFYVTPVSLVTQIDRELSVRYSLDEESDLFAREMAGIPISGAVDPSGLPVLSGEAPTGTTYLLEYGEP